MQIAEYRGGRRRILTHVGSARTDAELGLLLQRARGLLEDTTQGEFDLGLEPTLVRRPLVAPAATTARALFELPQQPPGRLAGRSVERPRAAAPRVVATSARLLYDVLAQVYTRKSLPLTQNRNCQECD